MNDIEFEHAVIRISNMYFDIFNSIYVFLIPSAEFKRHYSPTARILLKI